MANSILSTNNRYEEEPKLIVEAHTDAADNNVLAVKYVTKIQ